jgi:hypothetical protein
MEPSVAVDILNGINSMQNINKEESSKIVILIFILKKINDKYQKLKLKKKDKPEDIKGYEKLFPEYYNKIKKILEALYSGSGIQVGGATELVPAELQKYVLNPTYEAYDTGGLGGKIYSISPNGIDLILKIEKIISKNTVDNSLQAWKDDLKSILPIYEQNKLVKRIYDLCDNLDTNIHFNPYYYSTLIENFVWNIDNNNDNFRKKFIKTDASANEIFTNNQHLHIMHKADGDLRSLAKTSAYFGSSKSTRSILFQRIFSVYAYSFITGYSHGDIFDGNILYNEVGSNNILFYKYKVGNQIYIVPIKKALISLTDPTWDTSKLDNLDKIISDKNKRKLMNNSVLNVERFIINSESPRQNNNNSFCYNLWALFEPHYLYREKNYMSESNNLIMSQIEKSIMAIYYNRDSLNLDGLTEKQIMLSITDFLLKKYFSDFS